MSKLRDYISQTVGVKSAKKMRTQNAVFLQTQLGESDKLTPGFTSSAAQLCDHLHLDVKFPTGDGLRQERVVILLHCLKIQPRVDKGRFE